MERFRRFFIARRPLSSRRERNCLSVTDRYHNGNGDGLKVAVQYVE